MVLTRLVNLSKYTLEEFSIGSMPPYVAASHVWAENLFPVSSVFSISSAPGIRLIMMALSFFPPDATIPQYCWVDSWCIDQSSEEDKRHQIPYMADLYRDAECVIVTVLHCFTFVQEDWNDAVAACQGILDVGGRSHKEALSDPDHKSCLTVSGVNALNRACVMILEIANLPWATRIWTAQEHILGKYSIWIGSNGKALRLPAAEIETVLIVRRNRKQMLHRFSKSLGIAHKFTKHERYLLKNWNIISRSNERRETSIRAMMLGEWRKSTVPEDAIYGLMGASGVIITPVSGENLEKAWVRWWEASLRSGNLGYALTVVLPVDEAEVQSESWNCIMPPCHKRFEYGRTPFSANRQAIGKVDVQDGTLSVLGRNAGTCQIDQWVYHNRVPFNIKTLSRICGHDEDLAMRFCLAHDLNLRPRAAVESMAKAICAMHQLLTDPAMSTHYEEYDNLVRDFETFRSAYQMYVDVYIGQITNDLTTTTVLIATGEEIPEKGKLLALDLGDLPNRKSYDTKLMIVHVPDNPDLPMHKVGMTYPVTFFPKGSDVATSPEYGHFHTQPLEQFRIGGAACEHCAKRRKLPVDEPPDVPIPGAKDSNNLIPQFVKLAFESFTKDSKPA